MDTPAPTTPPPEQQTQTTTVTTEVKSKLGAEVETINTVIRKASPLSVGIALVLSVLGVICWFSRDVISKALDSHAEVEKVQMQMDFNKQRAEIEIAGLKREHDHCQENLAAMSKSIEAANTAITELKSEVASLKAKSVAATQ